MVINRETDYAFRIIECLCETDGRIDASHISEITNVTLRFTLKILRKLVAGGFVKSFKGINGGYELNRDPADITLLDLIECISGPIYFNKCMCDETKCSMKEKNAHCSFHTTFYDINKTIVERLHDFNFGYVKKV